MTTPVRPLVAPSTEGRLRRPLLPFVFSLSLLVLAASRVPAAQIEGPGVPAQGRVNPVSPTAGAPLVQLGGLLGQSLGSGLTTGLGIRQAPSTRLPASVSRTDAAFDLTRTERQKLEIFLERAGAAGVADGQKASLDPAHDPVLVVSAVRERLASFQTQDIERMPLEDLNTLSSKVLEDILGRSRTQVSGDPVVPTPQSEGSRPALAPADGAPHGASLQKPVPPPAPQGPKISDEAKRAIKGFSWARTFSIAVFSLYNIAFAMMSIAAVGRESFVTVGAIAALASIPLAFVNGVLVDKLSPRKILIGGSAILATVSAVIGTLAYVGLSALGHYVMFALIPIAIATQFMLIAVLVGEGSLVPKILNGDKEGIQRVNALFDLIFAGVSTVASLAGGWLVTHVLGFSGTFFLYSAVQLLVVIPIYKRFMPKDLGAPGANKPKPGMGESFARLLKSPYMLAILVLTLASVALVFPLRITMLPVIIGSYLHGTPTQLGYINTAVFGGMTVASLFNTFLSHKFKNNWLLIASAFAFAAFGVLLLGPTSIGTLFAGVALVFMIQTIGANVLRSLYMAEAQANHPDFIGRLMGISSAMYGAAIFGGTWLLKWAMGAAQYPHVLNLLVPAYALAFVLFLAAPAILAWARRRTHPDDKGEI